MSKKKKNKNKYFAETYKSYSKKDKKKNKKNKSSYKEPKIKTIHPSLKKADVKQNRKIVSRPIEIDEALLKSRRRCNHTGTLITVDQFKEMTPNWAAFSPMLEATVDVLGAENVRVCKDCFDVVPDAAAISAKDATRAKVILYSVATALKAHQRLDPDEIKTISKIAESLEDFDKLIAKYAKLEAEGRFEDLAEVTTPVSSKPVDLSALNKVDGGNGATAVM